jgi:hypothetical protein
MGRVGAPRLCLDALIHCVCDTSVDTICITPSRRCSLAPTYSSTRGARTAHTVHVPPLHLDYTTRPEAGTFTPTRRVYIIINTS